MNFKPLPVLVYSVGDPAGVNIKDRILEIVKYRVIGRIAYNGLLVEVEDPKVYLVGFSDDIIYISYVHNIFPNTPFFIYLSRHKSEKKVKSLTIHYPGNPGENALYGGKPRELAYTYPSLTREMLKTLYNIASSEKLTEEYSVVLEATHHGPTEVTKPVVFIEIGSSEDEWKRRKVGEVIALTVIETLKSYSKKAIPKATPVLGFGGGHYAHKHTKLSLEEDIAYGHIFAKYSIDYIDSKLIDQALQKTIEEYKAVVIEKKSIKSAKRRFIRELCESKGLKIIEI